MVDGGAASVIIVGTGPGGLASALLLAHSGVNGEREFEAVGREFGKRSRFSVRKSTRPHRHYEAIRIPPSQD